MLKKQESPGLTVKAAELVHFRLCHICFHLNEAATEVIQCEKCHRVFGLSGWEEAEFDDEMDAATTEGEEGWDSPSEEDLMRLPMPNRKIYSRVHGLSVLW